MASRFIQTKNGRGMWASGSNWCALLLCLAVGASPQDAGLARALGLEAAVAAPTQGQLEDGAGEQSAEEVAAQVRNAYTLAIDNEDVAIKVWPLPKNKFAVILSGELEPKAHQEAVSAATAETVGHPEITLYLKGLKPKAEKPKPKQEELIIRERWPLSHFPGSGGTPAQRAEQIENLVVALNALYPAPEPKEDGKNAPSPGRPIAQAQGETLWLVGPARAVLGLKALLAEVDAQPAQVQMEMWAVQVSGEPRMIAQRISEISRQVRSAQNEIRTVPRFLLDALRNSGGLQDAPNAPNHGSKSIDLNKGFRPMAQSAAQNTAQNAQDPAPGTPDTAVGAPAKQAQDAEQKPLLPEKGALSLLETLVNVAVSPNPSKVMDDFVERVTKSWEHDQRSAQNRIRALGQGSVALAQPTAWSSEIKSLQQQVEVLQLRQARFGPVANSTIASAAFPRLRAIFSSEWGDDFRHGAQGRPEIIAATRLWYALERFNIFEKQLHAYDRFQKDAEQAKDDATADEAKRKAAAIMARLLQPDMRNAAESLVHQSEVSDRLIKTAIEALAADVQEIYLEPLLQRAQGVGEARSNGVSLIGKTRIVVTDKSQAVFKPEMHSAVETSRPKPFGKDLFDAAFPIPRSISRRAAGDASNSAASSKTEAGEAASSAAAATAFAGLSQILGTLPQAQALMLAAAVAAEAEPEPIYTQVAPGVHVQVRPSVLADGGSARLELEFAFGVSTTIPDTTVRKDVRKAPPVAVIQTHRSSTDATVSGFDLFDISSFNMQTSHPETRYYPVLGSLPLVGRMFKQSSKNKVAHFESLVLVNTVILPRTLNLIHSYKGGWDSNAPQDSEFNPPEDLLQPTAKPTTEQNPAQQSSAALSLLAH